MSVAAAGVAAAAGAAAASFCAEARPGAVFALLFAFGRAGCLSYVKAPPQPFALNTKTELKRELRLITAGLGRYLKNGCLGAWCLLPIEERPLPSSF